MSQSRQTSPSTENAGIGVERREAPVVASGDESDIVSGVAADFESGHRLGRHRHRRAQLVYAVEGVMTVETDAGLWVVPPLRALWVPPGVVHSIRMTGRVQMRTVYFDVSVLEAAKTRARCAVLGVSPLLRELILRLVASDSRIGDGNAQLVAESARVMEDSARIVDKARVTAGDAAATSEAGRRQRLVAVILDELCESPVNPLEVPIPRDPRLRRIADAVLADPADGRDLGAWASFAGIGDRTLARLFPQETGMTFVRWRQQVRLLCALERLGAGEPVITVALESGYSSTSAFVKLFRENFGVTPGRYFADEPAGSVDAVARIRD